MGMLVVPTWKELMKSSIPGTTNPSPTPRAMAAKIQTVRYLSRKESFCVTPFMGYCPFSRRRPIPSSSR